MSRSVRAILILVLVLGVAAAVLVYGFQIRSIEITGNERHSSEQIRDDLIYDFLTENTLYFCWKYKSPEAAEDTPYLSYVQARMLSPTSVRIMVKENALIGRLDYYGQNVYFDSDGTVQEISDKIYPEVPMVNGISIDQPVLYQKLGMDNPATLRTMLSICQLLVKAGLIPDYVNFDESGNMTIALGSITVELGQDEYLEEKIANLVQLYPEISSQSGILNMEGFTGKNEAITFRDSADIAAAEAESETEESSELSDEDDNLDPVSPGPDETTQDQDDNQSQTADDTKEEEVNSTVFMVFDSGGNLRYDARVSNGTVVDSYGNPIDGCYLNEAGNVVDAYWNEIDPATGQVLNLQ